MNMILLTGPSLEPVTLAEMKLWLKIDGSEDDNVINALIVSARLSVEAVTKRILITQSWRVVLDEWRQGGLIRLPTGPLQSVTAARVYDAAGAATSVPVSTFLVDNSSRSPRLIVTGPVPSPGRWREPCWGSWLLGASLPKATEEEMGRGGRGRRRRRWQREPLL